MADATRFAWRDHLPGAGGMIFASANVVMQLGVPGVGHGVAESRVDSGNVLLHPWKRLRTTMTFIMVALCGTDEDRRTYARAINRVHRAVRSTPDSPVEYNAFDPELQLWVATCLYVGLRDARTTLVGPLTRREDEALLQASAPLGTMLQVPESRWHRDLAAFEEYWRAGVDRIRYDPVVRDHLMKVVEVTMVPRWLQWLGAGSNVLATKGALPEEFREAMGLSFSARERRRHALGVRVVRLVTRLTPKWARMLPVHLQLAEFRWRVRRGWTLA